MSFMPPARPEAGVVTNASTLAQEAEWTAERVVARLEAAGRTLLLLPSLRCVPAGYRTAADLWVRAGLLAYGSGSRDAPSARDIADMDQAYGWIRALPERHTEIRRVLQYRSLVHPRRDSGDRDYHLWGWEKLAADIFACDYRTVQRWHDRGVALILDHLDPASVAARRELDRLVRTRRGKPAARS